MTTISFVFNLAPLIRVPMSKSVTITNHRSGHRKACGFSGKHKPYNLTNINYIPNFPSSDQPETLAKEWHVFIVRYFHQMSSSRPCSLLFSFIKVVNFSLHLNDSTSEEH